MSIALRAGSGLALCLSLAGPALAQDIKPAEQPSKAEAQQPAAADPFAAIPAARPDDVKSLDAIIAALYDVISGDAGVQRDWNRFRSLFYPGARMIPSGKNARTGKIGARIASPEAYIQANESFLEGEGFHELELGRHVDSFGTLSQVFSAYEARNKKSDEKPFLRGINSIQLLNDGSRWWVLTIAWAPESPDNPLPERFTKKAER
jgi:hypothetical protein